MEEAYLSTPKFIKSLTDISDYLSSIKITREEKLRILKEKIRSINKCLPGSVYVPFVNGKIKSFEFF